MCGEFLCADSTVDTRRLRAFGGFIKKYGVDYLLECLGKNEKNGMVYHYPGKLTGDYDIPGTENDIIDLILSGKKTG